MKTITLKHKPFPPSRSAIIQGLVVCSFCLSRCFLFLVFSLSFSFNAEQFFSMSVCVNFIRALSIVFFACKRKIIQISITFRIDFGFVVLYGISLVFKVWFLWLKKFFRFFSKSQRFLILDRIIRLFFASNERTKKKFSITFDYKLVSLTSESNRFISKKEYWSSSDHHLIFIVPKLATMHEFNAFEYYNSILSTIETKQSNSLHSSTNDSSTSTSLSLNNLGENHRNNLVVCTLRPTVRWVFHSNLFFHLHLENIVFDLTPHSLQQPIIAGK